MDSDSSYSSKKRRIEASGNKISTGSLEDHAGVHARVQAVEGSRYTGTQVVIVDDLNQVCVKINEMGHREGISV